MCQELSRQMQQGHRVLLDESFEGPQPNLPSVGLRFAGIIISLIRVLI
jgi:hypothetical protein